MTDVLASKDLGNGLELRVEPSFGFFHESAPYKFRVNKIERRPIVFGNFDEVIPYDGLDISLYQNGKLCLSPSDNYYCYSEEDERDKYEAEVTRNLNRDRVAQTLPIIITRLARNMPYDLKKIYEILGLENLEGYIKNTKKCVRITRRFHTSSNLDVLFDEEKRDYQEIAHLWLKDFGEGAPNDQGSVLNTFTIYFVDPQKLSFFEKAIGRCYEEYYTNYYLLKESEIAIMNISLGYRARVIWRGKSKKTKRIQEIVINTVNS